MTLEIKKKLQEKLFNACESSSIDIVRHLLESPNLAKHIDLLANEFWAFKVACKNCDETLIDYLLTKPEIINSEKIVETISWQFCDACYRDELQKIHFFYDKEKYRQYIDLSYSDTWCFRTAYKNSREEVLQFLILEAGIQKNNQDILTTMRNERPTKETTANFVDILFAKQELMKDLSKNLSDKEKLPNKSKPKI